MTLFVTDGLLAVALDEVAHRRGPRRREEAVDERRVVAGGAGGERTGLRERGVVVVVVVEARFEAEAETIPAAVAVELVPGRDVEVRARRTAPPHVVGVAPFEEVGGLVHRAVVVVREVHVYVTRELEAVALVKDAIVQPDAFVRREATRRVELAPSAVAVGLAAVVDVVEVAEEDDARVRGVSHGEEAAQVSAVGPAAPFRVAEPAD